MRKIAILLVVGLMSAPLITDMPTQTYAAAKTKKAVRTAAPKATAPRESAGELDPAQANTRFIRALGDLMQGLATYRYDYNPAGVGGEDVRSARPVRRAPRRVR